MKRESSAECSHLIKDKLTNNYTENIKYTPGVTYYVSCFKFHTNYTVA